MYSPPTYGYFIFILISTLRLDFKLSFYTGFISALEYTIIVFYYHGNGTLIDSPEYSLQNILVKSVFYILGGIFAGLVSTQIKESVLKSVSLLQEKNEITQLFGRHVSPSVVNKLLETNMQLDSETRFVCVMFLDIRNFTKFSESRTPAEVVDYLNLLFSFMIEIVNRNNGIINKFLGDGFMAVYGAPIGDGKECENAIKTVQEILEEVKVFNLQFPDLNTKIGVGLHAGEAVTGNIGSDLRKEYTIIGDVVNLASRLEQLNKQFSTEVILSQSVKDRLNKNLSLRELGETNIRGKSNSVVIYTL